MSGFQQFGFNDNDNAVGKKGKRFKMDKNETARISFVWWPGLDDGKPDLDAKTPKFTGANRHFMKGVGYFINKGPEYTKIAGEAPKMRIATIIVKWPMRSTGKLDTEAISEGSFEVLPWVFDEGKYDKIKPIHGEWPLGTHDLKVHCESAQYQEMSFSPCRDSVLRKLMEKVDNPLTAKIIEQAQAIGGRIRDEIGRDMSLEAIRDKLAGGGGGAGGGGSSSPVVDPQSSEEIDDALDKLLE